MNNNGLRKNIQTGWCRSLDDYNSRWLTLNRPFFDMAQAQLPVVSTSEAIHIPGIGPGYELQFLQKYYPENPLFVSDLSPGMVVTTRNNYYKVLPFIGDISNVPLDNVSASLSFFTVHLVKDSLEAIRSQFASLRPGGRLFAIYFPPTPIGEDGPLVALHRASHALFPRPDSLWEKKSIDFLRDRNASNVQLFHLNAQWEFESLKDFLLTMEVLPHIRGIRKRAGEDFYAKLWSLCLANPGLTFNGNSWQGPVGASILTATKAV